jgi:fluoroquinolone transport system ATP-binding protein
MSRGASKVRYTYAADGKEAEKEILLCQTGEDGTLQTLIRENRLLSIHSSEPTLNDIFVELTGRRLQ